MKTVRDMSSGARQHLTIFLRPTYTVNEWLWNANSASLEPADFRHSGGPFRVGFFVWPGLQVSSFTLSTDGKGKAMKKGARNQSRVTGI